MSYVNCHFIQRFQAYLIDSFCQNGINVTSVQSRFQTMNVYLLTEEQINMELESRFSGTTGTLRQRQERLQRFLDIEDQKKRRNIAIARRRICFHWMVEKNPHTYTLCPDCNKMLYCEEGGTLVSVEQLTTELNKN
jgi:hypothetical protein